MGIEVSPYDGAVDTWDRHVANSPHGSIFHQSSFIDILEEHSDGVAHKLIGYKGEEPIGLFSVLEIKKAGISSIFSPPPRMGIPFQGPILVNSEQLKQRKLDSRNKAFIDRCLEWCDEELNPRYKVIRTPTKYDPRPFVWDDFTVQPRYTYHLDIQRDPEEIQNSFSKSLRRYIGQNDEQLRIEEQGEEAIRFIYEQMETRYEEQNLDYPISLELLVALYNELPDGQFRPYVGIVDGERVGGIIALEDTDTIYFYEGGGKPDADVPVNDNIHWEIITRACERGLSTYDLSGANNPRLCDYKSKFNPELELYYEIEKSTPVMGLSLYVYKYVSQNTS
ncbi:GNAT family N-acetyltransferase [Halomontanus rarus]|uniref:GNAT family N-acetyltransferase n=1 Tax=Halomontanus rarus TaxID=3034020 RepID=UPI001A99D435